VQVDWRVFVKVLVSAFQCCPGAGSEFATGWHWATTLADFGHEVTVLTSSDYRKNIVAAGPQGVDFRYIDRPVSPLRQLSPRLAVYDVYRRWQDEALRHVAAQAEQYDVAHHVTWGGLHLGSQLWQLPVPLVFGPVGGGQTAPAGYWRYFGRDWPVEMLRTASTGSLLKLNGRGRETVRNSAVTLVCNSATAAAAKRLGSPDVRFMLADGLPSDWLGEARVRPAGTPVVLWVGRMLPRKSPVLAVEAFAHLRRVMPARLIMAGDGPLEGQVRAAAERLGIAGDVELLGRVALADVKPLYDSSSVMLFTSLRESFGAPFLEALGRGLPTVALDLHGIGDMDVGTAALKVSLPSEPSDLAGRVGSALRTILSDGEWESRSAAAVSWAAGWVWPAKVAAATQIYREIAGRRAD
jgi:glycosyltransferase involved in cell wall biosynthesis